MNLPTSLPGERWLFTALIMFLVIVRVWGFRCCEMSSFLDGFDLRVEVSLGQGVDSPFGRLPGCDIEVGSLVSYLLRTDLLLWLYRNVVWGRSLGGFPPLWSICPIGTRIAVLCCVAFLATCFTWFDNFVGYSIASFTGYFLRGNS